MERELLVFNGQEMEWIKNCITSNLELDKGDSSYQVLREIMKFLKQ